MLHMVLLQAVINNQTLKETIFLKKHACYTISLLRFPPCGVLILWYDPIKLFTHVFLWKQNFPKPAHIHILFFFKCFSYSRSLGRAHVITWWSGAYVQNLTQILHYENSILFSVSFSFLRSYRPFAIKGYLFQHPHYQNLNEGYLGHHPDQPITSNSI